MTGVKGASCVRNHHRQLGEAMCLAVASSCDKIVSSSLPMSHSAPVSPVCTDTVVLMFWAPGEGQRGDSNGNHSPLKTVASVEGDFCVKQGWWLRGRGSLPCQDDTQVLSTPGPTSLTLEMVVRTQEQKEGLHQESSAVFATKHSWKMGLHFHSREVSTDHCCKIYQLGYANTQETTAGHASSVFPSLLSHSMIQAAQRPAFPVDLTTQWPVLRSRIGKQTHGDPDQPTMR